MTDYQPLFVYDGKQIISHCEWDADRLLLNVNGRLGKRYSEAQLGPYVSLLNKRVDEGKVKPPRTSVEFLDQLVEVWLSQNVTYQGRAYHLP